MNLHQPRLDDRLNALLLGAAVFCMTAASAMTLVATMGAAETSAQVAAQQPVVTLPTVVVVAQR